MSAPPRVVAVIGGGPRGISVVERLLANSAVLDGRPLHVIVIEPYRVGGGRIWDAGQPGHLLMNTLCADATHFTDSTVQIAGPIVPGPTLYEWSLAVRRGEITDLGEPPEQMGQACAESSGAEPIDAALRAEAARLLPHSHPSRRIMGAYLEWCHRRDLATAPDGVSVEHHRAHAQRIERSDDGSSWLIRTAATALPTDPGYDPSVQCTVVAADAVVLATGHSDIEPPPRSRALRSAAQKTGQYYGESTSPISQRDLDRIRPAQTVIVRGLGMNFFDYMSLLTIGRGGRFEPRGGTGELEYIPSGDEPILLAGSGRGVPYRAKGRFGRMTPSFPMRYLTRERIAQLQDRVERGGQVDFRADMLDAILRDGAHQYYTALAVQHPDWFAGDVERIVEALDEHAFGDEYLQQVIETVLPDAAHHLDVQRLDRPLDGLEFSDPDALTAWWLDDLRRDLAEADQGMASALKRASVTIGAGRAPLRTLVRYGGVRGGSYRDDVEGWFRGFAGMLASGPPARRIEELIALTAAGIVQPIGARMQVDHDGSSFTVTSPSVPGTVHRADALLEAHLPAANLAQTANPVLASLRDDGMARAFAIPDARDGAAVSGALEVGPPPYRVVNARGSAQHGLLAVGVPLESILWGTQLQPLACTNSRMLRETDAVAREALMPGIDQRAEYPGSPESPMLPDGKIAG